MDTREFPTTGPLHLEVRVPAGDITVRSADVDVTTLRIDGDVEGDELEVQFEPATDGSARLVVRQRRRPRFGWRPGRGLRLEATVPLATTLRVDGAAADLQTYGALVAVTFQAASGDAEIDSVSGSVDARVASGDVTVASAAGPVSFTAVSGDLAVGAAPSGVQAQTVSGDVSLGAVAGEVRATTVSGDVTVAAMGSGAFDAETVSGDVTVAVVPGTAVYLDLASRTGATTSDLSVADTPPQAESPHPAGQLSLTARSVSGDVRVRRSRTGSTAA
jgi:hypothetical protein